MSFFDKISDAAIVDMFKTTRCKLVTFTVDPLTSEAYPCVIFSGGSTHRLGAAPTQKRRLASTV